jgi:site-specific recombinase XerD
MDFDYETYEKERDAIREINELHLTGFEKWLRSSGLSKKTIEKHISNIDFYINEFLCYYDAEDVQQGCYRVGQFLGDWFIRKAMWASSSGIKSNAASFKKFYAYLLAVNVIEPRDYVILCETIKNELTDWLCAIQRYDEMLDEDNYF